MKRTIVRGVTLVILVAALALVPGIAVADEVVDGSDTDTTDTVNETAGQTNESDNDSSSDDETITDVTVGPRGSVAVQTGVQTSPDGDDGTDSQVGPDGDSSLADGSTVTEEPHERSIDADRSDTPIQLSPDAREIRFPTGFGVGLIVETDGAGDDDAEADDSDDSNESALPQFALEGTPWGSSPTSPLPAGITPVGMGVTGLAGLFALGRGVSISAVSTGEATAVAASNALVVAGSDLFDRLIRTVYPLRYSRYDDSDPLEHDTRKAMVETVEASPGCYLAQVSERAGLPLSTARHHMRVLEREDIVTSAKVRGRRRFYPANEDGLELAAALNDDATAAVVNAIAKLGPSSVSGLADELDKDSSTITHHLKRLAEGGIVIRERDGRSVLSKLAPEVAEALEPELDYAGADEAVVSAD